MRLLVVAAMFLGFDFVIAFVFLFGAVSGVGRATGAISQALSEARPRRTGRRLAAGDHGRSCRVPDRLATAGRVDDGMPRRGVDIYGGCLR